MFTTHFDLGIKQLIGQWRGMLSKKYLADDMLAGVIVACVAIPLSLAIALASGVPPEIGLVTAIVAGIVCAMFGGVPLAVSGPAAAMAVLVGSVVQDFGLSALLVIGFGCGVLQLLTGMFGLGALVRFVPLPVVMGFTAGIGAIILVGQFPRLLGLPAPDEAHVFSVIAHITSLLHQTQPASLLLALSTMAIALAMPKIWPRMPSPLFAVAIPSLVAFVMHIPVETVGSIPNSLPLPKSPDFFSSSHDWLELIGATFVVYALASLETLLSAGSVDQLSKSKPHNPNQELIGQGLGNIAVTFFGGIPVTAVIARSALNVHAGAKTRRAAIFHSLVLLSTVYFFSPVMSQIPIAVLAGLLVTIAFRMCNPHELMMLWHSSRADAVVYIITFIMIVVLGLMGGIQVGLIAALILSAIRLSQIKINLYESQYGPAQLALTGPLTFLSASKIDGFLKQAEALSFPRGLIIDLTGVRALDSSGAAHLVGLFDQLHTKNIKIALYGLDSTYLRVLYAAKSDVQQYIANSEAEMEIILGLTDKHHELTFDRLIYGIEKFKHNMQQQQKENFTRLAKSQQPHTLFITCSDSRIDPNLITSTQPGELFIVRNVGNIIPGFGIDKTPAEGAAVEYAIGVLNVKRIIVCGHSECGAMNQLITRQVFAPEMQKILPSVAQWLSLVKNFPSDLSPEGAAKLNASLQLESLRTYPIVKERLADKSITLHAFYYDIGNAELEMWDEVLSKYVLIGDSMSNHILA